MVHPHGGGVHTEDGASGCTQSDELDWSGSCSSSSSMSRSRGRNRGKDKHKGSKGHRGRDTRKESTRKRHRTKDKDRSSKQRKTKDKDKDTTNLQRDSGDDEDAVFPGTTYRFLGGKELPNTTNERAKQAYPRRHRYAILMKMMPELIGNLRQLPSIN